MPVMLALDDTLAWDAVVEDGAIKPDPGFFTAIALSLFSNAPASADELAEAGLPADHPCGWWADAFPEADGDTFGSKLWLLSRYKWDTSRTLDRGKQFAEEALAWMVEDGAARSIKVTTWRTSSNHMGIRIEVVGQDGERWASRWAYALGDGGTYAGIEE